MRRVSIKLAQPPCRLRAGVYTPPMTHAILSSRRLLAISGADALSFLQGLLSCDVRPAFDGRGVAYGALLSPQGKFMHDMFLYPAADGVLLDVDAARSEDLFARLKMYRLRSQVALEWLPENVVAIWGGAEAAGWLDPRLPEMGFRAVGNMPQGAAASEADYHRMRLMNAVPDGARDMVVDKSLLMEWGFEALHGVDFAKGCYVGQEVTARSKFRGQVRKSIYSVCIAGILPTSGTKVTQDEREVGYLASTSGGIGLALLQTEAVEAGTALLAGEVALDVALPKWLRED